MKENSNKKEIVRITSADGHKDQYDENTGIDNPDGNVRKYLIFVLMGVVFIGCMYLIFKPAAKDDTQEDIGLNVDVPGASEHILLEDKEKAYEQEIIKQKEEEKRNTLLSLADFWDESNDDSNAEDFEDPAYSEPGPSKGSKGSLHSYRNAQHSLSNFYREDESRQVQKLQKQIDELQGQQQPAPASNLDSQLALMEKSYEMASRYLPSDSGQDSPRRSVMPQPLKQVPDKDEQFVAATAVRRTPVSMLARPENDSTALTTRAKRRGFIHQAGDAHEEVIQPRNAIRAVIHQGVTLEGEGMVKIRLLEAISTPAGTIAGGTILMAHSKLQYGRLQLTVSSVAYGNQIIPVNLATYDIDGQAGLYVPFSAEQSAASEMAANMSQGSGSSIMMTRSAGQQLTADLGRGVVQGISGYFSKKARTPKVTLSAGHQVYLVSPK